MSTERRFTDEDIHHNSSNNSPAKTSSSPELSEDDKKVLLEIRKKYENDHPQRVRSSTTEKMSPSRSPEKSSPPKSMVAPFLMRKSADDASSKKAKELSRFTLRRSSDSLDTLSKFVADMKSLVDDPQFSDVVIHIKERKIYAHKVILCKRSEYFNLHFNINVQEKSLHKVDEYFVDEDIPEDDFLHFINYMYCDQVEMTQENVVSLFRLASKFLCTDLKERSEDYIKNHLTLDNVSSILILAHNNASPKLKKECLYLMVQKKKKLKQTQFESKLVNYPELLAEVTRALM